MTWMLALWLADKVSVSTISVTPRYGVVVVKVSAAAGRTTASAVIAMSQTCGNRVMGEADGTADARGCHGGNGRQSLAHRKLKHLFSRGIEVFVPEDEPSLRASCNWGFARVLPVTASFTARFCLRSD